MVDQPAGSTTHSLQSLQLPNDSSHEFGESVGNDNDNDHPVHLIGDWNPPEQQLNEKKKMK